MKIQYLVLALTASVSLMVLLVNYNTGWTEFVVHKGEELPVTTPPKKILYTGVTLNVSYILWPKISSNVHTITADITKALTDMTNNSWYFNKTCPRFSTGGLTIHTFSAFPLIQDGVTFEDDDNGKDKDGTPIRIKDIWMHGQRKILD
ncbi:MAG TPA: hypothetical protein VFQ26_07835 [Nitrospiraceae bacterium]|nr:hypothetical protein [Nitrospiraceae bacterium]